MLEPHIQSEVSSEGRVVDGPDPAGWKVGVRRAKDVAVLCPQDLAHYAHPGRTLMLVCHGVVRPEWIMCRGNPQSCDKDHKSQYDARLGTPTHLSLFPAGEGYMCHFGLV